MNARRSVKTCGVGPGPPRAPRVCAVVHLHHRAESVAPARPTRCAALRSCSLAPSPCRARLAPACARPFSGRCVCAGTHSETPASPPTGAPSLAAKRKNFTCRLRLRGQKCASGQKFGNDGGVSSFRARNAMRRLGKSPSSTTKPCRGLLFTTTIGITVQRLEGMLRRTRWVFLRRIRLRLRQG